jgi:hypothetical protein
VHERLTNVPLVESKKEITNIGTIKWRLLCFFFNQAQLAGNNDLCVWCALHFITAVSENAPSVKNCLPSQTKQLSQPILLFASSTETINEHQEIVHCEFSLLLGFASNQQLGHFFL